MLHWLAEYLTQYYSVFHVFSYLTFRAIISTLTALFISLYFGPKLIRYLQKMQIGQTVRDDGPYFIVGKPEQYLCLGCVICGCKLWSYWFC